MGYLISTQWGVGRTEEGGQSESKYAPHIMSAQERFLETWVGSSEMAQRQAPGKD